MEKISDEDMAALRSAPSWPGRVAAAHTLTREILGETQARLEPEQAAKVNVPVLLLTGEESTDPANPKSTRAQPPYRTRRSWCLPDSSTSPISWTRRHSPCTRCGSCTTDPEPGTEWPVSVEPRHWGVAKSAPPTNHRARLMLSTPSGAAECKLLARCLDSEAAA